LSALEIGPARRDNIAMTTIDLESALADAHLPALVCSLVHISGDASLLKPEWRPRYTPFNRAEIGVSEAEIANIHAAARAILGAYLRDPRPLAPLPAETVRKMMDFVTGVDIPEGYTAFVSDELAIGSSSKDPQWDTPKLKAAAAKMKVVIVGAGMSGLLTGIRLRQAGIPFEIIEKNPEVGGTWFENSYPGCRVDNANHMYSYSFEPNHFWPQHFSPQPVLLNYFKGIADRYDLRRSIRFETMVEEAAFDERAAKWTIRLRTKDGKEERVEANAFVTAVGQLNRPRFPDIKGRETFAGPNFHSAQWRHEVDLAGKRVAVIGTGASAFQFVPEIAPKAARVTVFQRTPPWMFPTPNYHADVPEGMKWLMEHAPFYDKWYRFYLFWMSTEGMLPAVRVDPAWNGPDHSVSQQNEMFRMMIANAIKSQLADAASPLAEKVIPNYPLGGKRALLDNGVWLAALQRENVDLVDTPIAEIKPNGVVTQDGKVHEADVLIYGTGFHASRFLMPMKIKGAGGRDLHEHWDGDARAYYGITVPGFPNLFMLYGPNTNIVVNGSIIFFSECAVRYIIGCLKLMAERGEDMMEVRRAVHDEFNARVDAENKKMAWGTPNVTSWYKNEKGRVSQNWPFSLIEYWRATLAPNPDDFILSKAKVDA
jgi:4-hydroxyacetophenone monooxygenase